MIAVKFSLAFILLFSLIYLFFIHYLACFLELICVLSSQIHVFLIYWEDKTLPLVSPVGVCSQISTSQNKNESLLFCVYGIISSSSLFVQVWVSIGASPFIPFQPSAAEGRCGCLLVFFIFLGPGIHLREYKERMIEGLNKKKVVIIWMKKLSAFHREHPEDDFFNITHFFFCLGSSLFRSWLFLLSVWAGQPFQGLCVMNNIHSCPKATWTIAEVITLIMSYSFLTSWKYIFTLIFKFKISYQTSLSRLIFIISFFLKWCTGKTMFYNPSA